MGEKTLNPIDPVAVLLVSKGSRGDKLLFRYPFDDTFEESAAASNRGVGEDAITAASSSGSTSCVPNASTNSTHVVLTVKKNASYYHQNLRTHSHPQAQSSSPYNRNPYTLPSAEDAQQQPPLSTTRLGALSETAFIPFLTLLRFFQSSLRFSLF